MAQIKLTEVDVAKPVVQWLKDFNWEVYQEVSPPHTSRCADILAVQNNIVWIIEVKRSLSLSLLEQINHWKHKVHYVSIAIPQTKNRFDRTRHYGFNLLKQNGIGCFSVTHRPCISKVREEVEPSLHRKVNCQYIIDSLMEEHKTFAEAGNADGKRWTPFKHTCTNITRMVTENPGILFKDLMINVTHHYASTNSARSSIKYWIESGIIDNIVFKKENKQLRVYLKE